MAGQPAVIYSVSDGKLRTHEVLEYPKQYRILTRYGYQIIDKESQAYDKDPAVVIAREIERYERMLGRAEQNVTDYRTTLVRLRMLAAEPR